MKILASIVSGMAVAILVGGCAICGPDVPGAYGERYLKNHGEPQATIEAVCNHKPLPPEEFKRLKAYSNDDVDRLLGENPSCPPEFLKQFSESPDWYIRRGVAINTNAPKDMLINLTVDPDWRVRYSANRNRALRPKAPDSEDWYAQIPVVDNPSTSPEVLRQIYNRYKNDEKYSVSDYFATNRNLPGDIARDIYLREKDKKNSAALESLVVNPAVSSVLLSEIYHNSKCEIPLRCYVQNPHCPPEIREAYQTTSFL